MKRFFFSLVFLWASVFPMSEEALKIGAKFAAMKNKTQCTLTAAKDVAPLIERIDKELSILNEKKKQLATLKQSLFIKKHNLQQLVEQKSGLLCHLHEQYNQSNAQLKFQTDWLNALNAQRSIQFELQLIAQETSRSTLLAEAFSAKLMSLISPSLIAWREAGARGLNCCLVEDVRG